MRPGLPFQLKKLNLILQRAVGLHGQHRYAARSIVRNNHESAARVNRLMHAVVAAGCSPFEWHQKTRLLVDRERRRVRCIAVDGVKKALISADNKKRWIEQIAEPLDVAPGSCFRIHPVDMNSIPV